MYNDVQHASLGFRQCTRNTKHEGVLESRCSCSAAAAAETAAETAARCTLHRFCVAEIAVGRITRCSPRVFLFSKKRILLLYPIYHTLSFSHIYRMIRSVSSGSSLFLT